METEGKRSHRFWFGLGFPKSSCCHLHRVIAPCWDQRGTGGAAWPGCNLPVPARSHAAAGGRIRARCGNKAMPGQEVQAGDAAVQTPDQHGLSPPPSNTRLEELLRAKTFNRTCCFVFTGREVYVQCPVPKCIT